MGFKTYYYELNIIKTIKIILNDDAQYIMFNSLIHFYK